MIVPFSNGVNLPKFLNILAVILLISDNYIIGS